MEIISLNGAWKLTGSEQESAYSEKIEVTATVPGCVQLDLSENGYLPADLFMGENIKEAEKYEYWEWWYEKTFQAPAQQKNVFLVFEGVDCIAEYFLNGTKIGESENMFIAHEFRIDDYLRDGENVVTVHIKSAVIAHYAEDYPLKLLASSANVDQRPIRKAPHSYGWDIMPRMVTAGLWRDVRIEVRDPLYFSQTFFQMHTLPNVTFYYTIDCDWHDYHDVEIEIAASCGEDSSFVHRFKPKGRVGAYGFGFPNAKKWFPYGYGEANVYDGTAKIYRAGELIHTKDISFGLRSVVLERTDITDGKHGTFRFLINGIEVMCKGSNWVPMDAFHCRDAKRYPQALALVKDIGCNILRCWGGNVYEDHAFFDFCDRNGIMIWQDFSFANAFYPETEKFKKEIDKEVTSVVRKLRQHPCIILWAGNNECDSVSNLINPDLDIISRKVIAEAVDRNDIGRQYLPSSPYITGQTFEAGVRSQRHGSPLSEDHLWGSRDYFKADFYKNNMAHFVSEAGYHGCPSLESIQKFITPEKVWPYHNNSEWTLHSTDNHGRSHRVELMEKQVLQLFGEVPQDPETYILASQISQAEAKKFLIERMRVGRPVKKGIIWWNLLDGWPQMSDAVVDYYYTKKLAYHYIKRSQAPFVIAADEIRDWNITLYACNDTLTEKRGHFSVIDASSDTVIYEDDFVAGINTSTPVGSVPVYYSEQKVLIIKWVVDGCEGFNHYLCGYPPISLRMYTEILRKYGLDR